MNPAVLDTDVVSTLMRRDPVAVVNASLYVAEHALLTISCITRFEVLRGLHAQRSASKIAAFETSCHSLTILPLTDAIIMRAAEIYGGLHRRGRLIGDADILIAATAMVNGREVVTNNTSHFERIEGLTVGNWLRAS